jgi:hypothetical protein
MLEFLRGKASDRKPRLFAVACCSRLDFALAVKAAMRGSFIAKDDLLDRSILEVWERYLEGEATDQELRAAEQRASDCALTLDLDMLPEDSASINAAYLSCEAVAYIGERRSDDAIRAAAQTADAAARAAGFRALVPLGEGVRFRLDDKGQPAFLAARSTELAAQSQLLRCIFGNSFQQLPAIPVAWLAWNDGTVAKLAAAIYDERRFADLPILADALEEAGCTDAAILAHCRGPGEHVRGCWAVDLLTGRH